MRKRAREIDATRELAYAVNATRNTDYEAFPVQGDPPDAMLVSATNSFPKLTVEITSLPGSECRTDNSNLTRLHSFASDHIKSQYPTGYLISMQVSPKFLKCGLTKGQTTSVIDDLLKASSQTPTHAGRQDLQLGLCQEIADKFTLITVLNSGLESPSEISVSFEDEHPPDGKWLLDAVQNKLNQYGGMANSDILLLDANSYVDERQIEDFKSRLAQDRIPWNQIWLVNFSINAERLM